MMRAVQRDAACPRRDWEVLRRAIRDPATLNAMSGEDWELLFHAARGARVWPRIVAASADRTDGARLPPAWLIPHLKRGVADLAQHRRRLAWATERVYEALVGAVSPVVLLKGAGYAAAGLPVAGRRKPGDIDILVPRAQLAECEVALVKAGWKMADLSPHQERYYRRWMHELPTFTHGESGIEVDVHHNILPRIDRLLFDAELLFAEACRVPAPEGATVLSPRDRVLHCAIHLFRRGDFRNGLRDLADLCDLVSDFQTDPSFWPGFIARTEQLALRHPVFWALRYARNILGLELPADVRETVGNWRPSWPSAFAMDRLVETAVAPPAWHGSNRRRELAHWLLARQPLNLWRKTIRPKLEKMGMRDEPRLTRLLG